MEDKEPENFMHLEAVKRTFARESAANARVNR